MCLDEEAQELCTWNTQQGLYKVLRMPYGINCVPAIFQKTMDGLFKKMLNVAVYIDDILIAGVDQNSHDATLQQVLDTLQAAGLTLNLSKCELSNSSVEFLGVVITKEGVKPIASKLEAVQKMKRPNSIKELKSFLGLINYYHSFLPNLAQFLEPLYWLLRSGNVWKWTEEQEDSFNKAKEMLQTPPLLTHFDATKKLILATDAGPFGLGAILAHQLDDGTEQPIAYASRTLNVAERNYSQTEKEALAVIFGIGKFHYYLYGHHFTAITDHRPLLGLFNKGTASY